MRPDPPFEKSSLDAHIRPESHMASVWLKFFPIIELLGIKMIEIDTARSSEVVDITAAVERALAESRVEDGICLVYTLHTTTGIAINEADPGLIEDFQNLLAALVPENAGYLHDRSDGNAHAHLRAALLGNSVVIPVAGNRPILGTWQRILFFELDGPRKRKVYVKAVSD